MADPHEPGATALPLRGVIITCTSLLPEERVALSDKATAMGAKCVLDLTSDVTHLICAALGSPKYKYVARMRADVKVLAPKWVYVMYDQWIRGEDINIHEFEREHKFPTLFGLKVSVTGITDVEERKRIEMECVRNGATYHPDLTRQVTHLLAEAPTGRKYDFAIAHHIPIVHPSWLDDSLARGMALDDIFYHPTLPLEKIGEGAKPAPIKAQVELPDYRGKRQIRQAAADKLSKQSQNLWENIMGHASNGREEQHDQWEDKPRAPPAREDSLGSVIAPAAVTPVKKTGILADVAVCVHGFDKRRTLLLRDALESLAATILSSVEALSRASEPRQYVLVSRQLQSSNYPLLLGGHMSVVTEWWLESCLHQKVFVEPSENDITTMAIPDGPIPDFEKLKICITLFTGIELTHWSKIIPMMGAEFSASLNTCCSVLIVNSKVEIEGAKVEYAATKKIPMVKPDWFIACVREQTRLPYEPYQIDSSKLKTFLVHGKSMLQFDASKRKANGKDNDALNPGEADASKRRRTEAPNRVPDGSTSGNKPPKSRSDPGEETKLKSKNLKVTPVSKILRGCRVYVSREKLEDRVPQLEYVARGLGANVIEEPTGEFSLTHLIRPSLPSPRSEDMGILERNNGTCSIVSAKWLVECAHTKNRLDEAAYFPQSPSSFVLRPPRIENVTTTTISVQDPPSSKSARSKPDLKKPLDAANSQFSNPPKRQSVSPQKTLNTSNSLLSNSPQQPISPSKHPALSPKQDTTSTTVIPEPPSSVPTVPLHEAPPDHLNTRPKAVHTVSDPTPFPSRDSRWSDISQLLTSVDKNTLNNTLSKPPRKPRTRLTGKLPGTAPTLPRQFSRTPSFASSNASQLVLDEAAAEITNGLGLKPQSQLVEYRSEEGERERRRVRRRLDPEEEESQATQRLWQKPKAVDADAGVGSVARRTRRAA